MAAVLSQRRELHGPPAYYTQDWEAARNSVRTLAALAPELVVSGHGQPWGGQSLRDQLFELAEHFDERERPSFGRYAKQPAIADASGVVMIPPDPLPAILAGAGAMAAVAGFMWATSGRKRPAA